MIANIFATKFFAKIRHLFHIAKSFYLLSEDVALFQQAEGDLAAVGGDSHGCDLLN